MEQQLKEENTEGVGSRSHKVRVSIYAEEFFRSLPLPAWVKVVDEEGSTQMLSINQAYTDTYGVVEADYVGKRDNVHWTSSETRKFQEQAAAVIKTGKPVLSNSIVLNRITGQNERVTIIKWPLYFTGKVIGVAGIILERTSISDKFIRTLLLLIPIKILKWLLQTFLKKKGFP